MHACVNPILCEQNTLVLSSTSLAHPYEFILQSHNVCPLLQRTHTNTHTYTRSTGRLRGKLYSLFHCNEIITVSSYTGKAELVELEAKD